MIERLFDMEAIPVQESKSQEWYTPARYIEAARAVMGGIDLDPASSEIANETVKASHYYTKEQNGLIRDWSCETMWINPPYGRENADNAVNNAGRKLGGGKSIITLFIKKLIREYQAGYIKQAILLVNSDTDSAWFVPLWEYSICFADHRVLFDRPGKRNEAQFFGTVFAYLGPNIASFVEHFTEFGAVIPAGAVCRRERPVQPTLWDTEEAS